MNERTCMMLAGEASGDVLAAELTRALKSRGGWQCFGAGGPEMAAAGVELVYDMTAHAVVGFWEVAKHYPQLRRVFNQLLALAADRLPEVILLVDYPGFNLRFVKAIRRWARRRRGPFFNWDPKIVYYVSPQLWAWRESRVTAMARDLNLLLSIFPFEKQWYAERVPDFRVEYVGHPILDRYRLAASDSGAKDPAAAIPVANAQPVQNLPLVALLPGSRARELRKHVPAMVEACRLMRQSRPIVARMVLPNQELVDLARVLVRSFPEMEIQLGGLAATLAEATMAIASSGTVTMECAYFGVPTVVLYRTSWATFQIAKRVVRVKYLAMPNLLADEPIYPELIQNAVTPERVAAEALSMLNEEDKRVRIKRKLAAVFQSLGPAGASLRAAQSILDL